MLSKIDDGKRFDENETGHVAMLIYEIVRLSYPIKKHEILLALNAVNVSITQSKLKRLLYLLEKIRLINHTAYSNIIYFYDSSENERRLKFGATKHGKTKDEASVIFSLRQSYVSNKEDEQEKKRKYALEQIRNLKSACQT